MERKEMLEKVTDYIEENTGGMSEVIDIPYELRAISEIDDAQEIIQCLQRQIEETEVITICSAEEVIADHNMLYQWPQISDNIEAAATIIQQDFLMSELSKLDRWDLQYLLDELNEENESEEKRR